MPNSHLRLPSPAVFFRTYLLGVACFLLFGSISAAQGDDATRHSWGCSSTSAESTFQATLNKPSALTLVPVDGTVARRQIPPDAHHIIYRQIDETRYGFSWVDFFVHRSDPTAEEGRHNGDLVIFVRLTKASTSTWWQIIDTRGHANRDTETLHALINLAEDEKQSPPVTILPATSDNTIPLFDMQWNSDESGNWSVARESHLLLDLRSHPPRLVASLDCDAITAYGACGVWDAAQQARSNVECDWDKSADNFICEHEEGPNRSRFKLLGGEGVPYLVPAGFPASLAQFAQMVEHDPAWLNRQTNIPGLGKTSHLLRLVPGDRSIIHLFGSQGGSFFYVILRANQKPELGRIPTPSLFAETPEQPQETQTPRASARPELGIVASQMKIGGDLSFNVKRLFTSKETHIFQITAKEGALQDGNIHSLFWLAVNDKQLNQQLLISMVQLATEALSYMGCNQYQTMATAAKLTIQHGHSFRALLDVEPSHRAGMESDFVELDPERNETVENACGYPTKVEWNHHQGWIRTIGERKYPATYNPRSIAIADDGTIITTPGKVDSRTVDSK